MIAPSSNARAFAIARELFAADVAAVERAWCGRHDVTASDAAEFRERMERIERALAAPQGAAA